MVRARKREAEALALRVAGATYQQIGDRVGLTLEGARQCVKRALERLDGEVVEAAKELRKIEAERLDAMTLALWERARRGDIPSIDCVLRLQSRRARLLRLDLDDNMENSHENKVDTVDFVPAVVTTAAE